MAVLTTQMTFNDPDMTVPVMDALSHGWTLGRQARNLNHERWEDRFAEPIEALRREFRLPEGGARRPPRQPALAQAA